MREVADDTTRPCLLCLLVFFLLGVEVVRFGLGVRAGGALGARRMDWLEAFAGVRVCGLPSGDRLGSVGRRC